MAKNIYLERYAYPKTFISTPPSQQMGIIVTIPCYNEPNLLSSLQSLYACDLPQCHVEVIVVINDGEQTSENIKQQNFDTFEEAKTWVKHKNTDALRFHMIYADNLPNKHAGVGLARKIAMDEAVKRFENISKKNGIIACYDADSQCDSNYLVALENHFNNHPKTPGCSIYFEHPLEGDLPQSNYEAIVDYELFLRYYTNALKFAQLPYAFQTIGSSMAVRSNAYQKQGGMNKRHAGEDFYFLHKIIALGSFTELKSTRIIPSPRQSDRVPFGTGRAVNEWLKSNSLDTYNPKTFIDLKVFTSLIEQFYLADKEEAITLIAKCSKAIQKFLSKHDFEHHLSEIKAKSGNISIFKNHFFGWFNAFQVLKYVHYCRDHYYSNISIQKASEWLFYTLDQPSAQNAKASLLAFRKLDNPEKQ